jgi:hypothetical protein
MNSLWSSPPASSKLRITRLESEGACAQIDDLAEELHGDRTAMFYGAPAPDRT